MDEPGHWPLPPGYGLVELPEDYAGFVAAMRLHLPPAVEVELRSGDDARRAIALSKLIVRWNFVDEVGAAIPLTPGAIFDLPHDMLDWLCVSFLLRVIELPQV